MCLSSSNTDTAATCAATPAARSLVASLVVRHNSNGCDGFACFYQGKCVHACGCVYQVKEMGEIHSLPCLMVNFDKSVHTLAVPLLVVWTSAHRKGGRFDRLIALRLHCLKSLCVGRNNDALHTLGMLCKYNGTLATSTGLNVQ